MAGRPLAAPGDVSVTLQDARAPQDAAPLAHWHFPAARTAAMFNNGPHGGIRLDLPMQAPPGGDQLRMMVHYTTRDGRKFEAQKPLDLTVDSHAHGRLAGTRGRADLGAHSAPRRLAKRTAQAARKRYRAGTNTGRPGRPAAARPVWSPEREDGGRPE